MGFENYYKFWANVICTVGFMMSSPFGVNVLNLLTKEKLDISKEFIERIFASGAIAILGISFIVSSCYIMFLMDERIKKEKLWKTTK